MLQEVRKLLFSEDVLHAAILDECAAQGVSVPNSPLQGMRVTGCRPLAADAAPQKDSVVLEFVTANPDKPYEVALDEPFVIGALIVACRTHSVPLPRSAKKKLQMTDSGLALTLWFRRDTHGKPVPEKEDVQPATV